MNEQSVICRLEDVAFLNFSRTVDIYDSTRVKNLSFRTRGLLRERWAESGGERNIQSISAGFFPACLFVLRASFGMHGVKIIINLVIESFSSTDLLGQMRGWSSFVSVAVNQSSSLFFFELQTHGSHFLGIIVNNLVIIVWTGTSSV